MSLLKRCKGDEVFYLKGKSDEALLQCHVVVDDDEGAMLKRMLCWWSGAMKIFAESKLD
jgi:hypothetical protein